MSFFYNLSPSSLVLANKNSLAMYDRHPVSRGHAQESIRKGFLFLGAGINLMTFDTASGEDHPACGGDDLFDTQDHSSYTPIMKRNILSI